MRYATEDERRAANAAAMRRYREKNRARINAKRVQHAKRQWATDPEFRAKSKKRLAEWIAKNPERDKRSRAINYLCRKHGITKEHAIELIAQRSKGCEVCGSVIRPALDHCHKSGRLRGVLCQDCNMAVGRAKDSPELLESLAKYVRSHQHAEANLNTNR